MRGHSYADGRVLSNNNNSGMCEHCFVCPKSYPQNERLPVSTAINPLNFHHCGYYTCCDPGSFGSSYLAPGIVFFVGWALVFSAASWARATHLRTRLERRMLTEGLAIPTRLRERVSNFREEYSRGNDYLVREITAVVEFVNTRGETVVRRFADGRVGLAYHPGGSVGGNHEQGPMIYHLADFPQSAYTDYGRFQYTLQQQQQHHSHGPSTGNYICFGAVVGMGVLGLTVVLLSLFYANLWHGLAWQLVCQVCCLPLTLLAIRHEARIWYQPYEDDLLRNIPRDRKYRPWDRQAMIF